MKNLYAIYELYVDDATNSTVIWYVYAANATECYNYMKGNYSFISDDETEIIENDWEIGLEQNDYDSYYNETIYGWEVELENVSLEDAKEHILKEQLAIV